MGFRPLRRAPMMLGGVLTPDEFRIAKRKVLDRD